MTPLPASRFPTRIAGLDSIRFFCALTVIFYHYLSPPIFAGFDRATPTGRIVLGLYDVVFNGQAAVIAFFLISGFCIHLPYATGRPFFARPFLLGRAARILIPTGAYLLLLPLLRRPEHGLTTMLWSIWCEIIYYWLYPLLRLAFARTSLRVVLGVSYLGAAIVVLWQGTGPNWHVSFENGLWTWLAALPCWLLGCLLAEHIAQETPATAPQVTALQLWAFRLGAWLVACASYLGMLHLHVSFLISLQFFAAFAYFWLATEIRWYRTHPASRLFESLGAITFSIYLVHQLAKMTWESFVGPFHGFLGWAIEILIILATSIVFYAAIEFPAHRLARTLARSARTTANKAPAGT